MIKCYECESGNLVNKKVDYTIYGVNIGKFPAQVCDKCGEQFFSEETSKEITKKTKELGLWGLETKTKIGVAGTTLDLRFSKKLIEFLNLKKGTEASIHPENRGRVVVDFKE